MPYWNSTYHVQTAVVAAANAEELTRNVNDGVDVDPLEDACKVTASYEASASTVDRNIPVSTKYQTIHSSTGTVATMS